MKCPICSRKCNSLKASVIRGGYMSDRCSDCAKSFVPTSDYAAKFKRDRMRENHRADLVQRFNGDKPNPEFAKLYPSQARSQFGDKYMETI